MNGDQLVRRDETGIAIQQTNEGFGSQSIVRANETASAAVAAQARAQIEARYIVAMRNPRDWDNVRTKLLKECSRPGFAAVARYRKPVGGSSIEGPSVRFAEAAIRCMGNLAPESMVIWDDTEKRIIRETVTDIESNVSYSADIVVSKTIERQFLKHGQAAISSRTNSEGKTTYLINASDDDVLNKQNALVSKVLRTLSLRHLPGDILDDCMAKVLEVQKSGDAQDPDSARKRLLDAFAKLNVMPSQLADYLGHGTTQLSPAELVELRAVYSALSEGETSWTDVMAGKKQPEEASAAAQKAVESVKARLAEKQRGKAPVKQQAAPKTVEMPTVNDEGLAEPPDDYDSATGELR